MPHVRQGAAPTLSLLPAGNTFPRSVPEPERRWWSGSDAVVVVVAAMVVVVVTVVVVVVMMKPRQNYAGRRMRKGRG